MAGIGAVASTAAAFASHGSSTAFEGMGLPALASTAIAWSAGVTFAFGASMRALARDRDEGVVALARARGVTPARYAAGRIAGLAIVLGVAVGGATAVACLSSLAAAGISVPRAAACAGALAYALAFAATLAPVAMATLGGRSRAGGYLAFLALIVGPELLAPWTATRLPAGWHELTSLPAALAAVRSGVVAPAANGAHLARAVAALMALAVASFLFAMTRVRGAERPEAI
jgi:hypothetical protein